MPGTWQSLERLGASLALRSEAPSRRMLVIVNPYATTVSGRLKDLVVHALAARYHVQVAETQGPGHAIELCREAGAGSYDVVTTLGGDGTVNEAANGLVGSRTVLTCLPGGSTNAYCRLLGTPPDLVDATERLLRLADSWHPRPVDLARVGERHFTFSSGLGLDASVVRRVDAHPLLKARYPQWYFAYAAIEMLARQYLIRPPRLEMVVDGRALRGVTAIVQNASAYAYFGTQPITVARGVRLDSGRLIGGVLGRANAIDVPALLWHGLSEKACLADHRHVHTVLGATELRVRSLDRRPIPLEADGEYLGEVTEAVYRIAPGAMTVLA
jgi:diacylglycerol kinase family enzyme